MRNLEQFSWGVVEIHHANAATARRKCTDSNGLQKVSARERQALARQTVAHQNSNATTAPSADLKVVIMSRACCRYVTTVIYFLEKNDVSLMPLQSRSRCIFLRTRGLQC
ncbi:hypothetical protein TcG_09667 [Trypanosoma cruzi]|nr:hypothetical protein TcG_09667 [Trypanosoma cruzi]